MNSAVILRFTTVLTFVAAIALNGCGGSPPSDSSSNESTAPPAQVFAPAEPTQPSESSLEQALQAAAANAQPQNPHAPATDPHAGLTMPQATATPSPFQWDTPEGWVQGPDRMMRAVTFNIGPNNAIECYVSVLGAESGGIAGNINRWRSQMGQPALDEAAVAALEKIDVLGQPSPLVEIAGDFTGMSGPTLQNYIMYGVVTMLPDQSVFIKMTGPAADMPAQKENFIAFCKSLRSAAE